MGNGLNSHIQTKGSVLCVCMSVRKGTPKYTVESAQLKKEYGIVGDAHAGKWHRQISLLDEADVLYMREKIKGIRYGAFGENMIISGLPLHELGIGSRLRIGQHAELVISQIGKVCHDKCAIFYKTGDCIMPRSGLFARVVCSGIVRSGDICEIIEYISRNNLQEAAL